MKDKRSRQWKLFRLQQHQGVSLPGFLRIVKSFLCLSLTHTLSDRKQVSGCHCHHHAECLSLYEIQVNRLHSFLSLPCLINSCLYFLDYELKMPAYSYSINSSWRFYRMVPFLTPGNTSFINLCFMGSTRQMCYFQSHSGAVFLQPQNGIKCSL